MLKLHQLFDLFDNNIYINMKNDFYFIYTNIFEKHRNNIKWV